MNKLSAMLRILVLSTICSFVLADEKIIAGEMKSLTTSDGRDFNVFVAGPESSKNALLIIHGWFGLSKSIRNSSLEFANMGYRVMAIDLFDGKTADNPTDAKQLLANTQQSISDTKYFAAINSLKSAHSKLAVMGWSYGGSQALHVSLLAPELVEATVCYYPFGKMELDPNRLSMLNGPMLIEVGNKDFAFTADKAKAFEMAMNKADKSLQINVYNAKHGFDHTGSENFSNEARTLALNSTQTFLSTVFNTK